MFLSRREDRPGSNDAGEKNRPCSRAANRACCWFMHTGRLPAFRTDNLTDIDTIRFFFLGQLLFCFNPFNVLEIAGVFLTVLVPHPDH